MFHLFAQTEPKKTGPKKTETKPKKTKRCFTYKCTNSNCKTQAYFINLDGKCPSCGHQYSPYKFEKPTNKK